MVPWIRVDIRDPFLGGVCRILFPAFPGPCPKNLGVSKHQLHLGWAGHEKPGILVNSPAGIFQKISKPPPKKYVYQEKNGPEMRAPKKKVLGVQQKQQVFVDFLGGIESSPKHGRHFWGEKKFLHWFLLSSVWGLGIESITQVTSDLTWIVQKQQAFTWKNWCFGTNKSFWFFLFLLLQPVLSFWFLGGFSLVRLAGFWVFRRGFLIQGNLPNPSLTEQWNHGWEWYLHGWRRRAHGKAPSHVTEAGNKGLNNEASKAFFAEIFQLVGFFFNTFR